MNFWSILFYTSFLVIALNRNSLNQIHRNLDHIRSILWSIVSIFEKTFLHLLIIRWYVKFKFFDVLECNRNSNFENFTNISMTVWTHSPFEYANQQIQILNVKNRRNSIRCKHMIERLANVQMVFSLCIIAINCVWNFVVVLWNNRFLYFFCNLIENCEIKSKQCRK